VSVVTARKEVEPGRHRAANRALTSARWNELPGGPFLPTLFTQDLEPRSETASYSRQNKVVERSMLMTIPAKEVLPEPLK
jgi:hypothetical protein